MFLQRCTKQQNPVGQKDQLKKLLLANKSTQHAFNIMGTGILQKIEILLNYWSHCELGSGRVEWFLLNGSISFPLFLV